jgi:putative transposase
MVARTLGWFDRYRRLSKDYELLAQISEAINRVLMIHLMIRPLARTVSY